MKVLIMHYRHNLHIKPYQNISRSGEKGTLITDSIYDERHFLNFSGKQSYSDMSNNNVCRSVGHTEVVSVYMRACCNNSFLNIKHLLYSQGG